MENKCKCGSTATKRINIEPENGFLYCCDNPKCREELDSFLHDVYYRNQYYQGRSYRNVKYSELFAIISTSGLIILVIAYAIYKIVNNFVR
jgi:hypothetical protein